MNLQKWRDRILYYPGSLLLLAWLPGYLKFKQDLHNPRRVQKEKLLNILDSNQNTEYGKKYQFKTIKSIKQFQEQVPIIEYNAIKDDVQRMTRGCENVLTYQKPAFFLTTSGTTGEPKYIPVTPDFAKEYHSNLWFFHLLRQYPKIAWFNTSLAIVTTDDGVTEGGHPVGAASGYLYRTQNFITKFSYSLPHQVFTIDDWDAKYYTMLRMTMEMPIRLLITNNPRTLLVLAKKLAEFQERLIVDMEQGTLDAAVNLPLCLRQSLEGKFKPNPFQANRFRAVMEQQGGILSPVALWPDLQAICCWVDGPARFYLTKLKKIYGNIPVHNMGYLASEGRGSIPLDGEGGVLAIHSHFFEFISAEEKVSAQSTVLTCDRLEAGQDYYILFTASNGLYRYLINDIVKVTGFQERTPIIQFDYRAGNTFDFTGEKLYENQIEESMAKALQNMDLEITDYTVIPAPGDPPFYRLIVESGQDVSQKSLEDLAKEFERELMRRNISYKGTLESELIRHIQLVNLPLGTLENFFKYHVEKEGAPYSQVKIGHLNPGNALVKFLMTNSLIPEDRDDL